MRISITSPRGIAPSVNPAVLADTMAQEAKNCVFGHGAISPLKNTTVISSVTKAGEVKSIFPFAGQWLNWIDETAVCRNPIANDDWDRVYFFDGVLPRYTVPDAATQGADYPSVTYQLGIPAPVSAPGVAVVGEITDDDPTLVETRYYTFTYVSAYGEEGPPSDPSIGVDVAPGQSVDLSGLLVAPAGAYNMTKKRIYRTNTGTSGTDFQLVGEVLIGVTEYSDVIESADLGSVLPSETWEPPPDDLHHVIELPCGAFAGLSGNVLCFSEPYMPHAWPPGYRISFNFDGMTLGAYGTTILVVTEGVPYIVSGTHPEAMTVERLEEGRAGISARGLVDMGYAVIYPSVDGLMFAGLSAIKLLTNGLINARDWAALNPETIHAYLWDGKYVAFWDNDTGTGGFVFDPATGDWSFHDVYATAGYADPATGTLYLVTPTGSIVTWDSGPAFTAKWRSKKFMLPYPASFSCGQVVADSYPVTVNIYADGELELTEVVEDADPFRLPGGFRAQSYEVGVETSVDVTMVAIASSIQELLTV